MTFLDQLKINFITNSFFIIMSFSAVELLKLPFHTVKYKKIQMHEVKDIF